MSLIRHATSADLEQLFALTRSFATSFQPDLAAFGKSFHNLIAQDDAFLVVGEESDQLIAYLLGFDHYALFASGRVAWVEEIMVREDRRRKGHAKELMVRFEDWTRSRGSKLVAVATRRAAGFYRALGYEESASYFRKLL